MKYLPARRSQGILYLFCQLYLLWKTQSKHLHTADDFPNWMELQETRRNHETMSETVGWHRFYSPVPQSCLERRVLPEWIRNVVLGVTIAPQSSWDPRVLTALPALAGAFGASGQPWFPTPSPAPRCLHLICQESFLALLALGKKWDL